MSTDRSDKTIAETKFVKRLVCTAGEPSWRYDDSPVCEVFVNPDDKLPREVYYPERYEVVYIPVSEENAEIIREWLLLDLPWVKVYVYGGRDLHMEFPKPGIESVIFATEIVVDEISYLVWEFHMMFQEVR